MKLNLLVVLLFSACITTNCGCSKSDSTPANPAIISTDPATLILGKWQVIKDSIVVHNFAFSDGTIPIPGVYIGTANDYWLFQSNGILLVREGGPEFSSAYQLISSTSLLFVGAQWGNVTIVTLTSNNFIWEKIMTSPNGGTYYRKAYFRK